MLNGQMYALVFGKLAQITHCRIMLLLLHCGYELNFAHHLKNMAGIQYTRLPECLFKKLIVTIVYTSFSLINY